MRYVTEKQPGAASGGALLRRTRRTGARPPGGYDAPRAHVAEASRAAGQRKAWRLKRVRHGFGQGRHGLERRYAVTGGTVSFTGRSRGSDPAHAPGPVPA